MADAAEVCVGCGEVSHEPFPWVAVMKDRETQQFASFPVCVPCWQDPAHRKQPLKAHFFPRAQEEAAVARAGSDNIGGPL